MAFSMPVNAQGMRVDQIEVEEAEGGVLELAKYMFLSPTFNEIRLWDPTHPMTDREFFALLCRLTIAGAKLYNDVPQRSMLQHPLSSDTFSKITERFKWCLHVGLLVYPAERIMVGKRYYMDVHDNLKDSTLTDYRLGIKIQFTHINTISTLPV